MELSLACVRTKLQTTKKYSRTYAVELPQVCFKTKSEITIN